MPALEPEVFILGKDLDINFNKHYFSNWLEVKKRLHEKSILVVHWQDFLSQKNQIGLEATARNIEMIHYLPSELKEEFFQGLEAMPIHSWLEEWSASRVEEACFKSVQIFRQREQEKDLLQMLEEQILDVKNKKTELEKSNKSFEEKAEKLKEKALRQEKRKEASERILLATLQSRSIEDLSKKVQQSLEPIFQVEQVKIKVGGEIALTEESREILEIPLLIENSTTAAIYFFRKQDFKKFEENYLKEISEVIAIAVDRWLFTKNLKAWEKSWLNTFSAVANDIAVIDQNYQLINSNRHGAGGKCYQVLFGKEEICEGCQLGKDFKIHAYNQKEDRLDFYDVSGQSLEKSMRQNLYVHFYYPLKEEDFYEKASLDSAKWVDLGIIGSSIAHELNNPLSGVLSYIQILLSEVDKKSEAHEILLEMQEAAKKSASIIKNMLNFSRKKIDTEQTTSEVKEALQKALQLVQADLNKEGIVLEKRDLEKGYVNISENALVQVLLEVLKNAIEELSECKDNVKKKITILCHSHKDSIRLEIIDNGRGIREKQIAKVLSPMFTTKNPSFHKGLGLTTANHLLSQRGAKIEILPNQDQGCRLRITLTRKKKPA